jgi:hypothetical protein
MDHTQQQLEEMVVGKPARANAVFYEHAVLNVPASKQAGRRMYDTKLYVILQHAGVKDSVSFEATQKEIESYPDEYQHFINSRQGDKAPGVEIIPNLDIAHLQELRDMQLRTIPQLAAAEIVPQHLEYARHAAVIFKAALEQANADEKESHEEESPRKTENVFAEDRQEHRGDVRRPEVPRSNGHGEIREAAKGNGASGRPHRGDSVNWGSVRIV